MRFNEYSLSFQPFVPRVFAGKRKLSNLRYRDAVLAVEMNGYGNKIKSFMLDGKVMRSASVPADLQGTHTIKIRLANNILPAGKTNSIVNSFSPAAPLVEYHAPLLSWKPVENAVQYTLMKNGKPWKITRETSAIADTTGFAEYFVVAADKKAVTSFSSEPVIIVNKNSRIHLYEAEKYSSKSNDNYTGFSGEGFTEVSTSINKSITIPVEADKDGLYAIDCRYANGNGPINTENKCALRTVWIDDQRLGIFVFPQRGTSQWENWGFSNALKVWLTKGMHRLSIKYLPANENINININQAMIDYIRLIRL